VTHPPKQVTQRDTTYSEFQAGKGIYSGLQHGQGPEGFSNAPTHVGSAGGSGSVYGRLHTKVCIIYVIIPVYVRTNDDVRIHE
jgi:hypothetical protein